MRCVGEYNLHMARICIVPEVRSGGMASFRAKFEDGLEKRGIEVTHSLDAKSDAVLVIGGTRSLVPLWRAKQRGMSIVQRLDGINWVQRVRWSGFRYTLRAEYGNALLSFIRSRLADRIIYQSDFIRNWWQARYGVAHSPAQVIINGVDINTYSPDERATFPRFPPYHLLVVEGSLAGGLDMGLKVAVHLAELLSERFPIKLSIAGKVDRNTRARLVEEANVAIEFLGTIQREQIPELMRSSHLLFSAEINPPCPNSVIEALACGLPVLGFDTGSLRELLGETGGKLVPYGGNPWKLEQPDVPALAQAAIEILHDQERFRSTARVRAEERLSLDRMVDDYLKFMLDR